MVNWGVGSRCMKLPHPLLPQKFFSGWNPDNLALWGVGVTRESHAPIIWSTCRLGAEPAGTLWRMYKLIKSSTSLHLAIIILYACCPAACPDLSQIWVFKQIIDPRRMHEGYSSRSVCLSVTKLAACCIPHLQVQTAALWGSLWHSKCMYCVDSAENTLFAYFGVICWW